MGRVLTLLYHRVNCLEKDINLLAVSPKNFYDQMLYLKQNYKIVKFDEDWSEVEQDAVCITFDDGYFDNYQYAFPILKKLEIPATIFVATGNLDTKEEYWWDELERNLLLDNYQYANTFELKDELFSCKWKTDTYEARKELYDTLHWLMYNKIDIEKRKNWMKQLREWSKLGEIGRSINFSIQLKECDGFPGHLITIGAHTINHPSLSSLSEDEQRFEIVNSKKELERIFNRNITTFSYPFGGVEDYDDRTIKICKECRFYKVASNFSGIYSDGCDLFQIPRNIVRNWDLNIFKKNIKLFWR